MYTRWFVDGPLSKYEWGGTMFRYPNGSYSYLPPRTDHELKGVNPFQQFPPYAEGWKRIGYYHTHGASLCETDEYFTDGFSPTRGPGDLYNARKDHWEFLLTPRGRVQAYDPTMDLILNVYKGGRVFLPDFLGPVYVK
jgi:hypothetical protein